MESGAAAKGAGNPLEIKLSKASQTVADTTQGQRMVGVMDIVSVRPLVAKILNTGRLHRWVARSFSCYLTYEWLLFTTQSDVAHIRYTFRIMIEQTPKVFLLFVIGSWLSTTDRGWRHKKTVYLHILPSLSTPRSRG